MRPLQPFLSFPGFLLPACLQVKPGISSAWIVFVLLLDAILYTYHDKLIQIGIHVLEIQQNIVWLKNLIPKPCNFRGGNFQRSTGAKFERDVK
jgi:hypothetical protein